LKRLVWIMILLAVGSSAQAQGVALRWDSCKGLSNRNFACDRSTGSELLVGSFSPPPGIDAMSGIVMVLRITSADGTIPGWWQMFSPGSCRPYSLSSSFDMSDQLDCDDPWGGQAFGAVAKYDFQSPNGVDVLMIAAVPEFAIRPAQAGHTYTAFKLLVNHQRSSGVGACAGCNTPMCIRLESIEIDQPGPVDEHNVMQTRISVLSDGISGMGGSSQVATWQGGTANCSAGLSKPSTWSQLKDRFRTH